MRVNRWTSLIVLLAAEVVLFLAAAVTSDESPSHPARGTESDVFSALFWVGILVLIVQGVLAFVRAFVTRDFFRRGADTYVHAWPGVAQSAADVQIGAESHERLEELSEQSGHTGDPEPL